MKSKYLIPEIIIGSAITGVAIAELIRAVKLTPSPPSTSPGGSSPSPSTNINTGSVSYTVKKISRSFNLSSVGLNANFTIDNIKIIEITKGDYTYTAYYNSIPIYGKFESILLVGKSLPAGGYAIKDFPDGLYVILTTYSNTNSPLNNYYAKIQSNGIFYFKDAIDISDVSYVKVSIGEKIGDYIISSPLAIIGGQVKISDIIAYKLPEVSNDNIEKVMSSSQFNYSASLYNSQTPYKLSFALSQSSIQVPIFDEVVSVDSMDSMSISHTASGVLDINGNDIKCSIFRVTAYNSVIGMTINEVAEKYFEKYKKYKSKKMLGIAYNLTALPAFKVNAGGLYGYLFTSRISPDIYDNVIFNYSVKAIKGSDSLLVISGGVSTEYGIDKMSEKSLRQSYKLNKLLHGLFAVIPSGFGGNYSSNQVSVNVSGGYMLLTNNDYWYFKLLKYASTSGQTIRYYNTPSLPINLTYTQSVSPFCPVYSGDGKLIAAVDYTGEYNTIFSVSDGECNMCNIMKAGEKYSNSGPIIPLFNKVKPLQTNHFYMKVINWSSIIGEHISFKDTNASILADNGKDWYHLYLMSQS